MGDKKKDSVLHAFSVLFPEILSSLVKQLCLSWLRGQRMDELREGDQRKCRRHTFKKGAAWGLLVEGGKA